MTAADGGSGAGGRPLTGTGLRVALLTYSTKPRGGVVHTLALAEALAATGCRVTVWALGRGGDDRFFRAVDPAVEVEVVPCPPIDGEDVGDRILRSIRLLASAFRPGDYDIVHAQDCISANAAGPCVRTVHHLDNFTTPALAACHERALVEPYAHLCVSASVAAELTQGWGLHPTVIPNGVAARRFAAAAADTPPAARSRAVMRERYGEYLLAVGGIEPRKGTLDLVEAYALARLGRPELQLVIAGGETLFDYRDYRVAFDRRCAELDVRPVLVGVVDDDELPALVAAAAAFGFFSTKEGFGLAAMEALAAGVPLVVRDLPVLREVFGGAARFASAPDTMAQQILRALAEPGAGPATAGTEPAAAGTEPAAAGTELAAAGRALAARHTWAGAAQAHLAFYARVGTGELS